MEICSAQGPMSNKNERDVRSITLQTIKITLHYLSRVGHELAERLKDVLIIIRTLVESCGDEGLTGLSLNNEESDTSPLGVICIWGKRCIEISIYPNSRKAAPSNILTRSSEHRA